MQWQRRTIPIPLPRLAVVLAAAAIGCAPDNDNGSTATLEAARSHGGLHATLPSVAFVGMPVNLRVSPLNELGTPDREWKGSLTCRSTDEALIVPGGFSAGEPGQIVARGLIFRTPGIHRVTVHSDAGDSAVAGPVRVVRTEEELRARPGDASRRLFWGDAHGHTDLGDGTNPPPSYLYYGRDIAHLDYLCLSEHDFQQFLEVGLDEDPAAWDTVVELAREWRRPGFAVLLGWEWSSRVHGHRVVLFPDDESRYVSFQDADSPADLAAALRGTGAVSVLAHPTGSRLTPMLQWDSVVPGFDRAIEIYSGHGTMDGSSDFRPTSEPRDGHSATDALARDLDLAFVAFSDTHLSTPGNPWPPAIRDAPYPGGLTGVWATGPSEREILDAIANGSCYATSGERFLVEWNVQGRLSGDAVVAVPGDRLRVRGTVAAVVSVRRVDLMSGTEVLRSFEGGAPELQIDVEVTAPDKRASLWLRGESTSGERFWTTPVRIRTP